MTRPEQTLVLALIFTICAGGAFVTFVERATRDEPQEPAKDMYVPRDCDDYIGLPDAFLDCVYPRPS